MLANGQEAADIRAKLDIAPGDIVAAVEGWYEEACPLAEMSDAAVERLVDDEIGGFMRLTMSRSSPQARREFSDQVLIELAGVPFSLLQTAMSEARRLLAYPERLVPFVFDFTRARAEKLVAEGDRLRRLSEIADGRQD